MGPDAGGTGKGSVPSHLREGEKTLYSPPRIFRQGSIALSCCPEIMTVNNDEKASRRHTNYRHKFFARPDCRYIRPHTLGLSGDSSPVQRPQDQVKKNCKIHFQWALGQLNGPSTN